MGKLAAILGQEQQKDLGTGVLWSCLNHNLVPLSLYD